MRTLYRLSTVYLSLPKESVLLRSPPPPVLARCAFPQRSILSEFDFSPSPPSPFLSHLLAERSLAKSMIPPSASCRRCPVIIRSALLTGRATRPETGRETLCSNASPPLDGGCGPLSPLPFALLPHPLLLAFRRSCRIIRSKRPGRRASQS